MQIEAQNNKFASIFSKKYWKEAALQLKDVRMITIAALIVALRIAVKFFKIPIAAGLSISFDAYVNSLGSIVYGPVVGLLVGAVSDVLGCVVTGQMGEYFLPFILVEMASSFIFGLFFWKRHIKLTRVLVSKFTVNLICNIIMTSVFMKWMMHISGLKYNLINGIRIAKNLIMFPFEATIIVIVLTATLPILTRARLIDKKYCSIEKPSNVRFLLQIITLTLISVILVLLYVFTWSDLITNLNIKFW